MEELLIEMVREHDYLYNVKSTHYRDTNIRQIAWEEIGRELKIPASEAKETWEKLRRCLCNARNRRREETKCDMASKKTSSWKYEQQMAFIIPFLETRKTNSNLNESQPTVSIEPQILSTSCDAQRNVPKSELVDDEEDGPGAKSARAETACDQYEVMKTSRNEKRKDSPSHKMVQILEENAAFKRRRYGEKNNIPNISETNLKNLDETDMFFLSMSRMTKQLSKLEQAKIKLDLSNSVLTAEIRAQQLNSQIPIPHKQSLPPQ